MNDFEEQCEQEFRDWLGWNDQPPPKEEDPDYYTFYWGLNVWINCAKLIAKRYEATRI